MSVIDFLRIQDIEVDESDARYLIYELSRFPVLSDELSSEHRHWDEWFAVVNINGIAVGYYYQQSHKDETGYWDYYDLDEKVTFVEVVVNSDLTREYKFSDAAHVVPEDNSDRYHTVKFIFKGGMRQYDMFRTAMSNHLEQTFWEDLEMQDMSDLVGPIKYEDKVVTFEINEDDV